MSHDPMASIADRLAVIDAVTRVAVLADRRHWEELRELFADPVEVDYTALSGGEPEELSPDDLVISRWKPFLEGFRTTQHMLTNHLVEVEGDEATCHADVRATHFLPQEDDPDGSVWQVGGL